MGQISELETTLVHFLDWNKARISCLVRMLQALFVVRTVNLTQIAEAFQTDAKGESSYRRIQRFFQNFAFDMGLIVVLVSRFFISGEKCVLIMDRTNWKWGKKHINILMLSVEHFGIGIPLFWMVGIVDPTKVVRCAIQFAASIAGLLLTTEAIITEEAQDKPAPANAGADMDY